MIMFMHSQWHRQNLSTFEHLKERTSEFQCINLYLKTVSASVLSAWKLTLDEACHEFVLGVHLDPGLVGVGDLWQWTHPSRARIGRPTCGWSSGLAVDDGVILVDVILPPVVMDEVLDAHHHLVRAEGILCKALYYVGGGESRHIFWWKKLDNMS